MRTSWSIRRLRGDCSMRFATGCSSSSAASRISSARRSPRIWQTCRKVGPDTSAEHRIEERECERLRRCLQSLGPSIWTIPICGIYG